MIQQHKCWLIIWSTVASSSPQLQESDGDAILWWRYPYFDLFSIVSNCWSFYISFFLGFNVINYSLKFLTAHMLCWVKWSQTPQKVEKQLRMVGNLKLAHLGGLTKLVFQQLLLPLFWGFAQPFYKNPKIWKMVLINHYNSHFITAGWCVMMPLRQWRTHRKLLFSCDDVIDHFFAPRQTSHHVTAASIADGNVRITTVRHRPVEEAVEGRPLDGVVHQEDRRGFSRPPNKRLVCLPKQLQLLFT